MSGIDATDRLLIKATQEGLPLTPRPYDAVGKALGLVPIQLPSIP